MSYGREAKLLCKKIVAFFTLLSKTQDTGVRKLGVTQELLSLVTGLAHYLKLLIRISLQGALKLERETRNTEGLQHFLEQLNDLESVKETEGTLDLNADISDLAVYSSDLCASCRNAIEDECALLGSKRWHLNCMKCASCGRELGSTLGDASWGEHEQQVLCDSHIDRVSDAQGGFNYVTKLEQYVYLLRVALARLLSRLRSGGVLPHTSGE